MLLGQDGRKRKRKGQRAKEEDQQLSLSAVSTKSRKETSLGSQGSSAEVGPL